MSKLLAALAALTFASSAHALLFCYNGDNQTQMEWIGGKFSYYDLNGVAKPNPGPSLVGPFAFSDFYCYADGTELAYIEANLPEVRSRAVTKTGPVLPICPSKGVKSIYWTGEEARWIWNNI